MKTLGYKCKSFDARACLSPFPLSPPPTLSRSSLAHLSECNAVHCRHNTVFYATSRRHFFSPTNEILRIRPVDFAAFAAAVAAAAFSAAFPLSLRQQVLHAAFQFHCQRAKRRKRENETSQAEQREAAGKGSGRRRASSKEEEKGVGEVGTKLALNKMK